MYSRTEYKEVKAKDKLTKLFPPNCQFLQPFLPPCFNVNAGQQFDVGVLQFLNANYWHKAYVAENFSHYCRQVLKPNTIERKIFIPIKCSVIFQAGDKFQGYQHQVWKWHFERCLYDGPEFQEQRCKTQLALLQFKLSLLPFNKTLTLHDLVKLLPFNETQYVFIYDCHL